MLVICPIPEDYLEQIQRIERTSNPYPWSDHSLIDSYHQFEHLGAFIGTQLVTFVLYRTAAEEAEIIHVVCDKTYFGNGYAKKLLTKLSQKMQEQHIQSLFLEVREDNYPARALYKRLGFETVGKRKNYYGGCHDAIIQSLAIKTPT